jgi:hypothetical protein
MNESPISREFIVQTLGFSDSQLFAQSGSSSSVIKLVHVPHVAPLAFLHRLFPPLSEEKIDDALGSFGLSVPHQLREFWRAFNGADFFSLHLAIYGFRMSFDRSIFADPQPFSFLDRNTFERPIKMPLSHTIAGRYHLDGSLVVLQHDSAVVERWSVDFATRFNTWPNFENFLKLELSRLSTLFDSSGVLLVPEDEITRIPDHSSVH